MRPRFKVVGKVPGEAESGIAAPVTMSTTDPPYSQLVWTFEDEADTEEFEVGRDYWLRVDPVEEE
jgi:hypothetical protein